MAGKRLAIFAVLWSAALGCEKGVWPTDKPAAPPPILQESWNSYVERFVQDDGRVIDHSAAAISTSEGQAYAMLRAVWMGDRPTFDKTFNWARNNLNSGVRNDSMWAWKWGQDERGNWGVMDKAFASDADQDAALALILAARVWNDEGYTGHARMILRDLWELGTIEAGGRRYLLAGDSLCERGICRINPSYYAPYAYRFFAEFDSRADWAGLAGASYDVLTAASRLTDTGLTPDWVQLDTNTGELALGDEKDSSFSYDAFRTYWRVEVDRALFGEPRAEQYLVESLAWLAAEWKTQGKLPAVISRRGRPLAEYESLEMLSALMCALRSEEMHEKLNAVYSHGIWSDRNLYYLQNWAWFGTAVYSGFLGPLEQFKPKA